ncbi:DUF1161 domain-containing protein [Pseudomonas sp. LB3P58]|jgi:hypothetical protein
MKNFILAVGLLIFAGTAMAVPVKSCEELKADIAAKLDAKGISNYSLEIVDKGAAADGKIVGTCEKGSKKIIYKQG